MCGIVGYVGERKPSEVILSGLYRLEYRGYDSAGMAVVEEGKLNHAKSQGKLKSLDEKLAARPLGGKLGIGHTRWATHGEPNEANSHPHFDAEGKLAIVHNGIIENFRDLREELEADGVVFRSDTDSEVIAHLIRKYYQGDLFAAVQRALRDLRGAYALGAICEAHPDTLVAARSGSPLIVGVGDGEGFIGSDVPAVMKYTRRVIYLDNGQICEVKPTGYRIEDVEGNPVELEPDTIEWDDDAAEKEGYPHFMLKEIHQQGEVLRNTLRGRAEEGSARVHLKDMNISDEELRACRKITIVACGTAWHAGMVGKYLIERFAKVPVELDQSSEYRYRQPIVPPHTITIAVSQSGETADTLEAIRIAKQLGAKVAAIVNTVGSSVARESHGVVYQQAGPEIGVASTKAYTSQCMAFALFAIWLATTRGAMREEEAKNLIDEMRTLPDKVDKILADTSQIEAMAQKPHYRDAKNALYLARGFNYASALEGALKIKEISYIHAEGCAAGEMKHGPIALITPEVPVVAVAVQGEIYDKMVSNIQEIKARRGKVISIATEGDRHIAHHSDDVIFIPQCQEPFSPILAAVPLQLLAYYIAFHRGCDVDQPRNLAKSVTVE